MPIKIFPAAKCPKAGYPSNVDRIAAAWLALFLSVPAALAAADGDRGGVARPAGSFYTLTGNTAEGIALSWNAGENPGVLEDKPLILFAHGPVDEATAYSTSFEWRLLDDDGQTVLKGAGDALPDELRGREPTVRLREMGIMAGRRLASLNPSGLDQTLTLGGETRRLVFPSGGLRIEFGRLDPVGGPPLPREVELVAEALIPNHPPLRSPPPLDEPPEPAPYLRNAIARIVTAEAGLASVPADEILPPGEDGSNPDLEAITLYRDRKPVPYLTLSRDGSIRDSGPRAPGDRLVFHVPPSDSPFSNETVIWAVRSGAGRLAPGLAASDDGGPDTARAETVRRLVLEENRVFMEGRPRNTEQQRHWMWADLANEPVSSAYFQREPAASATAAVRFTFASESAATLAAATAVFHATLDGLPLELSIPPHERPFFFAEATLPANRILPGTREIGVAADFESLQFQPGPVFLDKIEILHGAAPIAGGGPLPATGPGFVPMPAGAAMAWIEPEDGDHRDALYFTPGEGESFTLPPGRWKIFFSPDGRETIEYAIERAPAGGFTSDLTESDRQADAVLIAPRRFEASLERYAESLRKRGHTVRFAAAEDMYNLFGGGRFSPFAIRDFLRYAFANWDGPPPSYVVLVGDATWDYLGYYRMDVPNVLPSYQPQSDYAEESWFVRLDGPDDELPDAAVSRLPVRTPSELETVLDKTLDFIENPPVSEWLNRMFVLTDDEFERYTDELRRDWIPKGFRIIDRHIRDYPLIDNIYLPERLRASLRAKTSLAATEDIVRILNEGVFFWLFYGHGAPNVMGRERMFFGGGSKFSDVRKLEPNRKPHILWSFSCETTRFDYPQAKWNISIGEDLLTSPESGSLAILGAAGRGYPHDHLTLAKGLIEAAFVHRLPTFGTQYYAAQLLGMAEKRSFEPARQFAILGDPALPMPKYIDVPSTAREEDGGWRIAWDFPAGAENAMHTGTWLGDGKTIQNPAGEVLRADGGSVELYLPRKRALSAEGARVGAESIWLEGTRPAVAHGAWNLPAEPAGARVEPSTGRLPDLAFKNARFDIRPETPRSGETVFFDAIIQNRGLATAEDVHILGYSAEDGRETPLDASVGARGAETGPLNPGESESVTIRWDPTGNAGTHTIVLRIDPNQRIAESDETNNAATAELRVLRKADLYIGEDTVSVTPSPDGSKLSVDFEVHNLGESVADKTQIHFILHYRDGRADTLILPPRPPRITEIEPGGVYSARNIGIPATIESFEITADPDEIVDEETHENNTFRYRP